MLRTICRCVSTRCLIRIISGTAAVALNHDIYDRYVCFDKLTRQVFTRVAMKVTCHDFALDLQLLSTPPSVTKGLLLLWHCLRFTPITTSHGLFRLICWQVALPVSVCINRDCIIIVRCARIDSACCLVEGNTTDPCPFCMHTNQLTILGKITTRRTSMCQTIRWAYVLCASSVLRVSSCLCVCAWC